MGGANHLEYRQCTAASRVRNQSPIVPTSSYTGEMQALFYGFGMAGVLKGLLEELLFGIGRGVCVCVCVGVPTYVRNDNSDAAYQVDRANSVTSENG